MNKSLTTEGGTVQRSIARHQAEVKRLSQEGVSRREIAKRTEISRASVRHFLGDGSP